MAMVHAPGASYKIGTKDGNRVYLDVYSGTSGEIVSVAELTANQARNLGQALLDAASKIDPPNNPFPCVVNNCTYEPTSYDDLNTHSRENHLERHGTSHRYPGCDRAGDFIWHAVDQADA